MWRVQCFSQYAPRLIKSPFSIAILNKTMESISFWNVFYFLFLNAVWKGRKTYVFKLQAMRCVLKNAQFNSVFKNSDFKSHVLKPQV